MGKHDFSVEVIERNAEQRATSWRGTCKCKKRWTGSTYEATEDKWRVHVYEETQKAPKPCGQQENRWSPDERGCTTIAATLWISLPVVTVMAAAAHHYVIAAVLAYIGGVFALLALMHWGARQAQSIGRSQDEALDDWMDPPLIDFDSLPLIDRIAAVEGPKLADEAAVWLWLETRGDAS